MYGEAPHLLCISQLILHHMRDSLLIYGCESYMLSQDMESKIILLRPAWEENYKEGIETSFKTHLSSVPAIVH